MIENKRFNVKIKNMGPINNSDFQLKPFSVFIGPNNSGKSYASLMIHALTYNYEEYSHDLDSKDRELAKKYSLKKIKDDFYTQFSQMIKDFLMNEPGFDSEPFIIKKEIINEIFKKNIGPIFSKNLTLQVQNLLTNDFNKLDSYATENFEVSFNDLIFKKNAKSFELDSANIAIDNFSGKMVLGDNEPFATMNFEKGDFLFYIDFLEFYNVFVRLMRNKDIKVVKNNTKIDFDVKNTNDNIPIDTLGNFFTNILIDVLESALLPYIFNHNSYYIPVGKTEVMHNFLKIISQNLNNNDHGYSLSQKKLADNIIKLDNTYKSDFFHLANKMEKELFNGSVDVQFDDVPKILFKRDDGLEIETKEASSSIAEITPIILYLKHVLHKGDTFIVEEPESHLHPKNQRILIKYLIKAMNNGLRVLITTHSDYILEQLNNLIKIDKIQNEHDKKHVMDSKEYANEDLLDSELVNIYHFKEKEDNIFEAHKLEIGDFGIEESNFQDVVDDLYDETEMIDNLLTRNE